MEGYSAIDSDAKGSEYDMGPAVTAAANGISTPRFKSMRPDSPTATFGKFFETLTSSDLYKNTKVGDISGSFRSITAKNFLTAAKRYLERHQNDALLLGDMVTCQRNDTLKQVIRKLDSMKIRHIYVVDETGNLEGLITLRDIISKLVHEPHGYFGDFFDGVLPWPANSRV